jgi:hypothetical protein
MAARNARRNPVSRTPQMTMDVAYVQALLDDQDPKWSWSRLAREMDMSKSTIGRVADYLTLPGGDFIFALQAVFPEHKDRLWAVAPAHLQKRAA